MKIKNKIEKAKMYPIESLVKGKVTQQGRLKAANCPWHNDSSPSLKIYPNNTFYCFAGCGGGDAITFYRKLTGCDFKTAVEELSNETD